MALSDKNIIITPNIGAASDPKIVFSGADASTAAQNITLTIYPTNSGTLSIDGSTGQLFSVTNSMSGTIFSANDVSGIPSIEVIDTGLVKLAQYSGNVLLGTGTDTGLAKLQVTGSLSLTGNILNSANSKSVYGPNSTWSSYLHVGGDGVNGITRTGSIASIVTTNGNLHLDSGSDKIMYLNYYSGTGGVIIGNGAGGASGASISATGVFTGSGAGLTNVAAATVSGLSITNGSSLGDNVASNYIGYVGGISLFSQTDGALYSQFYSSSWQHQIFGDYSTGQLAVRGKNGGTWQSWRTVLDSSNYTSYAPTLTGGSASGTWGISITGNAAYAANSSKLYSTDSQYTYGSASPYYGYLTYISGNNRWRFQVSPATPAGVEVAYADSAGNGGVTSVNGSTGAVTVSTSFSGGTVPNATTFSSAVTANYSLLVEGVTYIKDSIAVWNSSTSSWLTVVNRNAGGLPQIVNIASVSINAGASDAKLDVNGNQVINIAAVPGSNIDCSLGNFFTKTINGATTFTFSTPPSSRAYAFTLELTHTTGGVTWPTSVAWPASTVPTLTAGKTHLFTFVTDDAGTRWRGAALVDYTN